MKINFKSFAVGSLQAAVGVLILNLGAGAINSGMEAWKRRKTKAKESANPA